MIQSAVALKDLSILQPMSVKDAIWIDCERSLATKDEVEYEQSKVKFLSEKLDSIHIMLMDIREIDKNNNIYVQVAAKKGGTKRIKLDPITNDDLPSGQIQKQREEAERLKNSKDASEAQKKKEEAEMCALTRNAFLRLQKVSILREQEEKRKAALASAEPHE